MVRGKKGQRQSSTTPASNRTNWHNKIINWGKESKFISACFVSGGVFVFILTIYQGIKSISGNGNDSNPYRGDNKKITDVSQANSVQSNKTSIIEYLFSKPYEFYCDSSDCGMTSNQIIDDINMLNEDISININVADPICFGYKYVMVNEKINGDTIIHKIIPANNLIARNREKMNDYYEDVGEVNENELAVYNRKQDRCIIQEDDNEFEQIVKFDNPAIEIKINNNANENIMIDYIEAKVKKSCTNAFPLPCFENGYGLELPLFNYASGVIHNTELFFTIQKKDAIINYNQDFKYYLKVPIVQQRKNLEFQSRTDALLLPFFEKENINTKAIIECSAGRENGYIEFTNDDKKKLKKQYCGNFPDGVVRIVGKAIYEGTTPYGIRKKDTITFNFIQKFLAPGRGGGKSDIHNGIYSIKLESNSKNYIKKYNIAESFLPKSGKSFKIIFYSGDYAFHYFDLVIHYNATKQIEIKNIFLNEFLLSSDKDRFKSTYSKSGKL